MVDVDALNDEELRDELVTRGVNVGPIVATTRSLYVNKLKRLLGAENMSGDHLADENNATQNGFITNGDTHHAQPEQFVRVRNTNLASSASTTPSVVRSTPPVDDTSGKASVDQAFLNENQQAQQSDLYYSRNQYTSQQQILHSEALKPTIFEDSEGLPSPPPQLVPYREHSSSSESSEVCGEESSRQLSWQEVQQLVSPSPLTVRSGIRTHTLYTGSAHPKAYCEGSEDCSVPSRTSSEASKSFTTIGFLVILAIFLFFVIQNIVSYNRGDATYEEL